MEIHKLILENLTSGIITLDSYGTVLYINPMAEKILHINHKKIIGKTYNEAFGVYFELENLITQMIKKNKTVRRGEIEIGHGSIILKIGYSSMPLKNEEGKHFGYNIIFQDLDVISAYDK
ncbi:MAG TPA: PAS domain-containing protein [Elusimicrobiales bacterium]|nr:PAS domain-containing protein [Elusimicrobiales bacterium]